MKEVALVVVADGNAYVHESEHADVRVVDLDNAKALPVILPRGVGFEDLVAKARLTQNEVKFETPLIGIDGSHGYMYADPYTGQILYKELIPEDNEYGDYVWFDIAEWKRAYPGEEPTCVDILDCRLVTCEGELQEPEEEFRKEIKNENRRIPR